MEIDTIGINFRVFIYDTYVIKVPIAEEFKDLKKLKFIAETQSYLSRHIDGILPCEVIDGNKLKMPKADGMRVDKYEEKYFRTKNKSPLYEFQSHVNILKKNLIDKIEELGYYIGDVRDVNVFYNKEKDKIYFIDFSDIKLIKESKDVTN